MRLGEIWEKVRAEQWHGHLFPSQNQNQREREKGGRRSDTKEKTCRSLQCTLQTELKLLVVDAVQKI